jgi:RNA polymerase sigma factor (sigma-70 family)
MAGRLGPEGDGHDNGARVSTPLRPIARRALAAQSDDRLVRLLREGHEPAFDEIVRRYRDPLVAFAGAIAGASRAEDVVQASLMRAHRALGADEREIRLRPWLFAIVRNGALNAVRDEPAWSELDSEQRDDRRTPATAEEREELERLVDAICALPESQRQALVMREMEGVGHTEIAAKLKTSPTAVRGLIFRARTTLRNALGALVPLPILRWLLEDAAAAAAAGAAAGGAGAGAAGAGGGALLGGAFGKAAVGLTAAVVAVGAGKAIQDRRSGDDRPQAGPETARAATGTGSESGRNGGSDGGSTSGSGDAVAGEERREAAHEGAEERRERQGEAAEEDREARADRGDDRDDARENGHSGSGGGGGPSGGGGGSSGSSGGGSGGHEDDDDERDDDDRVEAEEPEGPEEPDEPDEPEGDDDDDHSGPGGGSDDEHDD